MPNTTKRFRYTQTVPATGARLLHADEVTERDFPRARRGLDPHAVKSWLRTVADSLEGLQEELRRVREERDRLARAIERSATQPVNGSLRAALAELKLKRGLFGYAADEVELLLESTTAELARLETHAALLEAENAELREHAGPGRVRESFEALQQEMRTLAQRLSLLEKPSGAARTVDAGTAN